MSWRLQIEKAEEYGRIFHKRQSNGINEVFAFLACRSVGRSVAALSDLG